MAACLWALALHLCIAHAAGALQGSPGAARLVRAKPVLARGPPAPGARSRALLATLGESDAPPGLRRAAQVSDRGRFRSTLGVVHYGSKLANGYDYVQISRTRHRVNRLICTAWHGPPPTPKHRVTHKDLDPSNNTPANLEWATPREKKLKTSAGVLSKPVRGREQGTEDEWRHFESCAAAARELGPGFNNQNIRAVLNGRYTQTGGWTFEFTPQETVLDGEWRTVMLDGVESGVQVSDRGRFRSPRGVVHCGSVLPNGYHLVGVGSKRYYLHRLICTAWHGPPPTPKHQVKHLDLDPSNNTPANLRWATSRENTQRSHDTNPNRKSNAGSLAKPVRGRKAGTVDEWRHFESCNAAERELGPGFFAAAVGRVAQGRCTQAGGWMFEYTQQYEDIAGEIWKDVVLPSALARRMS